MLIPEFKIQQDQKFLTVIIRVPYVKITACQFYIQEHNFKFYLKPYLLSLNFQQSLKEAVEPAKAVYQHQKHLLTVTLQKKIKGQNFQNLNLLSNVLSNKKSEINKEKKVLIQVMDEKGHKVIETQKNTNNAYNYGFCGNYCDVFKNLEQQATQLFSFNPKDVSIDQRFQFQNKIAYQQFDENSYLYDKLSNFQEIDQIVQSNQAQTALIKLGKQFNSKEPLTYQKFKLNLKLPNKEIMVAKEDHANIWKQLFSIAFSYVYELICMQGELSVQSPKSINKTNAVLSANILYKNESLIAVIYDCCRRCVTYSLYKHLDICQKVINILKKQLDLHLFVHIVSDLRFKFQKCQPRYLLNRIYLDDYLVYLLSGPQQTKNAQIKDMLIKNITKLTLKEEQLGLDIHNEQMGSMMQNDSQYVDNNDYGNGNGSNDFQALLDMD